MGESIVYALKVALVVAFAIVFFAAIGSLLSIIVDFFASGVTGAVGEALAIISSFLPFNPGTVFSAILASADALITFFVAKKVYDLSMNNQKAT